MQLSKLNIKDIKQAEGLSLPPEKMFDLPEKVLQFGTGVLLRGLPDYFIDKANRAGIFNGRIVVVKSTSSGGADDFKKQDGLYTLCIRGLENGKEINEKIIHSCISRVISAGRDWNTVLEAAADPNIQVIISNTTEVGITLVEDDIWMSPPLSFPGKLLAFFHERYKCFGGSMESGMVIIPTELISDNGARLKEVLIQLAIINRLDPVFIEWMTGANHFCNSLVDRIVPGKLPSDEKRHLENELGYSDELMITAEPFRLWAIESSNQRVKEILSFATIDKGVVIAPDIEKFRELKLRLLNGTHSFSCALAILCGFKTVKAAMQDTHFTEFVKQLAFNEIPSAIEGPQIPAAEAREFAESVIERFCNPYLEHNWLSIATQYTSKMRMRNVPLILRHYERNGSVPELMALGFAGYIVLMKGADIYPISDDQRGKLSGKWKESGPGQVAPEILSDEGLWGVDLDKLPGFSAAVQSAVDRILADGAMKAVEGSVLKKSEV